MFTRRSSGRGEGVQINEYSPEDNLTDGSDIDWVNKLWVRRALRGFAMLSFVSVSMNTPKTFVEYPQLNYITFAIDLISTLVFTAEMIAKMHIRGIVRGEAPYLKDKWCQFDFCMVMLTWASVILQIFELTEVVEPYSFLSMIRCPRPLILIRVFRVFLKFQLPKTRMASIFKRSSVQIRNVTTFFLFFMSLYGILGVQFFGELKHHCVRNGTNPRNVSVKDLAIPDTYCSPRPDAGYQCPRNMVCMPLELSRKERGFNGFDELATSFFTVYEAASQEGWVFIMYRTIDSLPSWRGYCFFISMIFFLTWLVKNVFIAVIIETFAEIRVHFQQAWGPEVTSSNSLSSQVLQIDGDGWKMVAVDESRPRGLAPAWLQRMMKSASFQVATILLVLANAITVATIHFDHNKIDPHQKINMYYYAEVGFTILFDIEALFKIWCLGIPGYLRRTVHKFELFVCIGTTLHIIPALYRTHMTYFQVLRIVRLIKASPVLEEFCWKIFGPGRKLGSLVIFTMCLLIITSCVSLQLFCCIQGFHQFETFPQAFMSMFQIFHQEGWSAVTNATMSAVSSKFVTFVAVMFAILHFFMIMAIMSMFQILTQKGWPDVMHGTMWQTGERYAPLVAVYFIFYHLFITLIVVSLFVAVILDNLELDEDIKRIKQLKNREEVAQTQQKLPLRLRVFEKFPDSPQMVFLPKVSSDFDPARMRDSFLRQFLEPDADVAAAAVSSAPPATAAPVNSVSYKSPQLSITSAASAVKHRKYPNPSAKKQHIFTMIRDASQHRVASEETATTTLSFASGSRSTLSQQHQLRIDYRRSMRGRPGSLKEGSLGLRFASRKDRGDMRGTAANKRQNDDFDIKILQQKKFEAELKRTKQEEDLRENHPYFDTPLFAIGRESRFRKLCQLIVSARYQYIKHDPVTGKEVKTRYRQLHHLLGIVSYVDWIMIIVTILSCISMMFENSKNRVMDKEILQVAEYTFVICMSLEMTLKVLANGLFFTPNAVVKDIGGVFDVFIYAVSLVFLCWMPKTVGQNSTAQMLMILRCLRPLRIFILFSHMRRVVYELLRGFKEILLVSVLLILLIFMFAQYGVQLFGGKLARCNDPLVKTKDNCTGIFERPVFVTKLMFKDRRKQEDDPDHPKIFVPRVWANPRNFNFDNIGNAMLALFECLTLEGWLEVRDAIIDRVGSGQAIFIHLFIFIGCNIGLTLFVGVVIANYMENKGTALLTVDQKRWQDLMGRIKLAQPLHIPPRPDTSPIRAFMYDVTQHKYFKRGIALLILANCGLLCVPWKNDEQLTFSLASVSAFFTVLFFFEVVMKILALSPTGYWQSRRNRFDMFVTILGLIWVLLHVTLQSNDISNTFGYIIIILRFFTITGKHATLKMLMLTIAVSVFKSFFIILGMFLLMLFYAYTGVILFGNVKYGENLGRHANFKTASNGIVLLLRIVTGEDWNKILHDCMVAPPFCTLGQSYWETDCGNTTAALIYFCSFYVIIAWIVLNLLVAIIMENFSLFYSNEEDALLSYNDIRQFQNIWSVIDTHRKGIISLRRARFLLRLLRDRLEVDLQGNQLLFKHMCYELEKLRNGDDVTFHDVLSMLAFRTVDIRKSLQLEQLLAREELEFTIEEEVAKQTIRNWLDKCLKRIRSKENSNIINSLRATTEPLVVVTDIPSLMGEGGDAEADHAGGTHNLTLRQRKKVEKMMSAPLPGSQQAMGRKLLSLSATPDSANVRSDKSTTASASDAKRKTVRCLAPAAKNLPDVSENDEMRMYNGDGPNNTTTVNSSSSSSAAANTSSAGLTGYTSALNEVHKWWKDITMMQHRS